MWSPSRVSYQTRSWWSLWLTGQFLGAGGKFSNSWAWQTTIAGLYLGSVMSLFHSHGWPAKRLILHGCLMPRLHSINSNRHYVQLQSFPSHKKGGTSSWTPMLQPLVLVGCCNNSSMGRKKSLLMALRSLIANNACIVPPEGSFLRSLSSCGSSAITCWGALSLSERITAPWHGCYISKSRKGSWPGGWNISTNSNSPSPIGMDGSISMLIPYPAPRRMREPAASFGWECFPKISHVEAAATVPNGMTNGLTLSTRWMMLSH